MAGMVGFRVLASIGVACRRSPPAGASATLMPTFSSIERDLHELCDRPGDAALHRRLAGYGLEVLPPLAAHFERDLPIAVLEGYEAVLKAVLRGALEGEVSGVTARTVAEFQRQVGLLLKYKSYAVKASSPLGYSVFLQNPGEGFSFQRHLTHKTEVFHILDVHPGGFVFLCSTEEWERAYEPERFAAWLAGAGPDPAYDRYKFAARPGDVFVLDELAIVHTVIGCILEEFATISTDMVDRLHDQNAGRPIPAHFTRDYARRGLETLRTPAASRVIGGWKAADRAAGPLVEPLLPRAIAGGAKTVLADGFVVATQYHVEPRGETAAQSDPCCAASLYVRAGAGRVLLGTADELNRATPPSLAVAAHDLLTIPHGIHYAFVNESPQPLELVEHKIHPHVALH
jgi:mannose-6-phosphate isomerase-like protein (cupin superfamily)